VTRDNAPAVVTYAADNVSDLRHLGVLGHVSGIQYGSTMPGGDDQFQCNLQLPKLYRDPALTAGRIVNVVLSGATVYEGRLDRPIPASDGSGWSLTAHGSGSYGDDYRAIYTTYTVSNIITAAIARGLQWQLGPVASGVNYSQVNDSASQTVTDFLNAVTDTASLTWMVDQPGSILSIIPVPSTVTRLLVTTTAAAADLVNYINDLYVRYQTSPDGGATAAAYALTHSTLPASVTAHGRTEDYDDLSTYGQLTVGSAQSWASGALAKYVAASFSSQFQVTYGQYLTTGGVPVDLPNERAGEVVQLVLAAGGFGGELAPTWPITFPVGAVGYDNDTQTLTVTPYQAVLSNFSGLLGVLHAPAKPKKKPPPKKKAKKRPAPHHTVPRR